MNLAYSSKYVFEGYRGCFVYYEIFIDVFFLINMVLDYFLLRIVNRLLKCSATHLRSLLGSVLGALGVCLIIIWPARSTILNTILVHVVINTFMVKFGCKIKDWRMLIRGILLLYAASFLCGGALLLLRQYTGPVGLKTFLFLSTISYLMITAGIKVYTYLKKKVSHIYDVVLYADGKHKEVKGLYDTGNRLRDPFNRKPVSIVDGSAAKELFPSGAIEKFKPHYIPFKSVGCNHGVILTVTLTSMCLKGEGAEKVIDHPVIALAQDSNSFSGDYQMILNPDLIDS